MAGRLHRQLLSLRPVMAQAAQQVYDEWEQTDECDAGGICDEIANALSGVVAANIADVDIEEGGHDGDDHAWVIVRNAAESLGVDIPAHVYETGGGYCWKKIPNVRIQPNHVEIWKI